MFKFPSWSTAAKSGVFVGAAIVAYVVLNKAGIKALDLASKKVASIISE